MVTVAGTVSRWGRYCAALGEILRAVDELLYRRPKSPGHLREGKIALRDRGPAPTGQSAGTPLRDDTFGRLPAQAEQPVTCRTEDRGGANAWQALPRHREGFTMEGM